MLQVSVKENALHFGEDVSISFQRTLRIPDDGHTYPLPPGLGDFPVRTTEEAVGPLPESWQTQGGVFIPMYQREALWLAFNAPQWKPHAIQVGIGGMNAISGEPFQHTLNNDPQNYVVAPYQFWLDGINAGQGFIRQFVAMPLGSGVTVEAQLTGQEEQGGIQIIVYAPKPGIFPDQPPPANEIERGWGAESLEMPVQQMGLGAGGKMKQKIYPDPHGPDTWDSENRGSVFVHIVNSDQYRQISGQAPPTTPISAETYTMFGFPWFDLYDEPLGDVAAPGDLATVQSIDDLSADQSEEGDKPIAIKPSQVKKLHPTPAKGDKKQQEI